MSSCPRLGGWVVPPYTKVMESTRAILDLFSRDVTIVHVGRLFERARLNKVDFVEALAALVVCRWVVPIGREYCTLTWWGANEQLPPLA